MDNRLPQLPLRPMQGVTEEESKVIRFALRRVPTWTLLEAYELATYGNNTGIALLDQRRLIAISALEEMLAERGELRG